MTTTLKQFDIIVAVERSHGIGKDNQLPWPRLSKDLSHFRTITSTTTQQQKQNAVIMGRKTWESIDSSVKPLKNRINVVLSTSTDQASYPENVHIARDLQSALDYLNSQSHLVDQAFVIGGARLYSEAIGHKQCRYLYVTRINADFECDRFFPAISEKQYRLQSNYSNNTIEENGVKYQFQLYKRIEQKHEEYQYLELISKIIEEGNDKSDRTGVGTMSIFGSQMRFNLRDGVFPLLTTKRVFWRGVAEELLWFVAGHTNGKLLQDKGIHIWDGNGSRQYLDSIGLKDREEMDLGPVYGFQWRHFGAKYVNMHTDYTGQGFDQLIDCINKIKNKPDDRRIIMSAWNPADLTEMALPPCHMFCQFYVANGELSCQMYQRSCDMGLG
jgi:dihydrofolate reductase/thymidylate synthase